MKSIFAFAALIAASAAAIPFGSETKAQVPTLPCAVAADRIATEQSANNPLLYNSYYERAFSECTNNGDNPFTQLPTGNPEKLCERVRCQKAY
jgi:hypothetical protein